MALDYSVAEVNLQPRGVIYLFLAGASLSNETRNLDKQSWGKETHPQCLKKPSTAFKSKQMSSTGKEEGVLLVRLLSATNHPAFLTHCLHIKYSRDLHAGTKFLIKSIFLVISQNLPFYSQLSTAMQLGEPHWDINFTVILFFKAGFWSLD